MFSATSPQKRKHSEYHDPDYEGIRACASKRPCEENSTSTNVMATGTERAAADGARVARICEIISREFQSEITLKQQQLMEIEQRLIQARNLLDRLRFAIVANYYRQQELPLSSADAAVVRGKSTLFEEEPHGPQMPFHPSLKKIIGKRPHGYADILARTCPERAAAQNALSTIRARSQAKRRQERRLQQLIREQGLVIDHSKDVVTEVEASVAAFQGRSATVAMTQPNTNRTSPSKPKHSASSDTVAGGALNATRLNNKTKHVIVIGNTSKYIGADGDGDLEQKSLGHMLSHKWLIYVQSKDSSVPLENFVKKVRFFLHSSYRPNDIVDIVSPPFQVARRGWGEFPVRIQLVFHERMQQKPVQLVHNLVLDKTLSGLHTMGAETLMEIWLRNVNIVPRTNTADVTRTEAENRGPVEASAKARTISFTQNKEELDDNLFAFLNRIDATPAAICEDIEKIQPTVVLTEPLAGIASSPTKVRRDSLATDRELKTSAAQLTQLNGNSDVLSSSPKSDPPAAPNSTQANQHNKAWHSGIPATLHPSLTPLNVKAMQQKPFIVQIDNISAAYSHNTNNSTKMVVALEKADKLVPDKAGNPPQAAMGQVMDGKSTLCVNGATTKTVLERKRVQFVDAAGTVKYLQMLVAVRGPVIGGTVATQPKSTSSVPNITQSTKTTTATTQTVVTKSHSCTSRNANACFFSTSQASCSSSSVLAPSISILSVAPTNQPSAASNATGNKSIGTTKNVVFQKEGKLYIIDPLQVKLKQQRRKQISLLKPQVSLLKQQQELSKHSFTVQSIAIDHDYTPARPPTIAASTPVATPLTLVAGTKANIITQPMSGPALHPGIRQMRAKASSIFELQQQQRIQYERKFLQQRCISMCSAVEFLLRRLPLVAPKHSPAAAFPFVRHTESEFQALPPLKQRACEWLRAKCVSRCMRNHKDLQQLDTSGKEKFWSTREVVLFARYHAYTPVIKEFAMTPVPAINPEDQPHFTQLVKSEVKYEQQEFQFDSLTAHTAVRAWVDKVWQFTEQYEDTTVERQMIDVVGLDELCERAATASVGTPLKQGGVLGTESAYLPPPDSLELESQVVGDICRELGVRLSTEEIVPGVLHPIAQTVLAQSLHIFIEKLLRRSVAVKLQQPATTSAPKNIGSNLTVDVRDIGKAIAEVAEFDFLSNSRLGTCKYERSNAGTH